MKYLSYKAIITANQSKSTALNSRIAKYKLRASNQASLYSTGKEHSIGKKFDTVNIRCIFGVAQNWELWSKPRSTRRLHLGFQNFEF